MLEMGMSRAEVIDLLKEKLTIDVKKEASRFGADDPHIVVELKLNGEVISTATTKSLVEDELL